MIRETYKGRKILVTKGKEWGYAQVKVNGVSISTLLGTQERALSNIRANIDYIGDEIDGARWGAEWYAPGTFELCANDHPQAIGGTCTHPYCMDEMCSDCGTPKKDHCAICSLCQWFCNDKKPAPAVLADDDTSNEDNPTPAELAMLQTILDAVPMTLPGGTVDEIHDVVRGDYPAMGVGTLQGILTTLFLRCETHIANPVRGCYVNRRYVREY